MITTTVLIAIQFKYVKGLSGWLGLLFFLTFGFFDGTTQSIASRTKTPLTAPFLPRFSSLVLGRRAEEDPPRCLGAPDDRRNLVRP